MKKTGILKAARGLSRFVKTLLILTLTLSLLFGIAVAGVNLTVIFSTDEKILTVEKAAELEGVDCIMILGCQAKGNKPSNMLKDRIDCAVKIYNLSSVPIFASGDSRKKNYDEVGTIKTDCIAQGVPEEDISGDGYGLSTYDSMYRAAKLYGYKKMVIVTQEYHLYRAIYIAESMGIEAYGVSADTRKYNGQLFRDVRELAARAKDFAFCLIDADAERGLEAWKPFR